MFSYIQKLSERAQFFSVDRSFSLELFWCDPNKWSATRLSTFLRMGLVLETSGLVLFWEAFGFGCLAMTWPLVRFCARRKFSWHHQLVLHSGAPHLVPRQAVLNCWNPVSPLSHHNFLAAIFLWPSLIPFNASYDCRSRRCQCFQQLWVWFWEMRTGTGAHCAGWTRGALILLSLYSQPTH